MNWRNITEEDVRRAVTLTRLVEELEVPVIDNGIILLDQALEKVYTEIASGPLHHDSREEAVALMVARMRKLLVELDRQRGALLLELRILVNQTPLQPQLPLSTSAPEYGPGATWE